MQFILPKLKTPLGIAIVAPSGAPLDEAAVVRGIDILWQQGFTVHSYYQPEQRFQRFGGSDEQRSAQLHAAASNPDVSIVMALRGSYGFSRLLPHLDLDLLAKSGKVFVGYSDFTVMHQAMLARGRLSIAGPMLYGDFGCEQLSEYTLSQFIQCISGQRHQVEFSCAETDVIDVQGRLWGGNLAMLTHMIGTPYWTEIEGGILFLEDIGEHPYRVERMLLQMHFAGILEKQKAIVLGDFSGYQLAAHDQGYDFSEMLRYIRSVVKVPVITGLPFGHISDRTSLVVGSATTLKVANQQAQLIMEYQL